MNTDSVHTLYAFEKPNPARYPLQPKIHINDTEVYAKTCPIYLKYIQEEEFKKL